MDVFSVHDRLIDDYSEYVRSFLSVADERAKRFVEEKLIQDRSLWPDALIQLNPAYEKAATVDQLSAAGRLHPECAAIFRDKAGNSFPLRRHLRGPECFADYADLVPTQTSSILPPLRGSVYASRWERLLQAGQTIERRARHGHNPIDPLEGVGEAADRPGS